MTVELRITYTSRGTVPLYICTPYYTILSIACSFQFPLFSLFRCWIGLWIHRVSQGELYWTYSIQYCADTFDDDYDYTVDPTRQHCQALFKVVGDDVEVQLASCYHSGGQCAPDECIPMPVPNSPDLYFCCCDGNLCNRNIKFTPPPTSACKYTCTLGIVGCMCLSWKWGEMLSS